MDSWWFFRNYPKINVSSFVVLMNSPYFIDNTNFSMKFLIINPSHDMIYIGYK